MIVQNAPSDLLVEMVVANLIDALIHDLKTVAKLVNNAPWQRQWLGVGWCMIDLNDQQE